MKRYGSMKELVCVVCFVLLTMVSFVSLSTPAIAADDTAALIARMESLEKEMAEVKKALADKEKETKAKSGIELSGKAYLTMELDANGSVADTNSLPRKSDSEFRVDRWYFTAKKKMSDKVGLTMTTDVRTTTNGGRFDIFMKNAYIDVKNVVGGATLVVGQQGTPWIGNEEKAWKYRVVRQTISDERGLLTSADFGVALKGDFADKKGDYQLLLSNGEGYGKREEGLNPTVVDNTGKTVTAETVKNANGKDLTGRITFKLGKNAPRLSLYGDIGSAKGNDSNRWAALLDQQIQQFSYGVSYIWAKDANVKKNAMSLYGNYDFIESKWSLFGRYDNYDPDKSVDSNKRSAIIAGVAYKFDKTMMLTVSGHIDKDQTVGVEDDATIKAALEIIY